MSRIAAKTGEPVEPTKRRTMTTIRRFRVWDYYGGKCGQPHCRTKLLLHGSGMVIDHIVPIELGGADNDPNLWPLCPPCNAVKTAKDQADIAKARRIRKREAGKTKPKRKIVSRGFDKSHRKLQGRKFSRRTLP